MHTNYALLGSVLLRGGFAKNIWSADELPKHYILFFYFVVHISAKQITPAVSWLVRLAAKLTNQLTEISIKKSRDVRVKRAFYHEFRGDNLAIF